MNKEKLINASLLVQIGLGIFTLVFSILTFIEPRLTPLIQWLLATTIFVTAINNHLQKRSFFMTILLLLVAIFVVIGSIL